MLQSGDVCDEAGLCEVTPGSPAWQSVTGHPRINGEVDGGRTWARGESANAVRMPVMGPCIIGQASVAPGRLFGVHQRQVKGRY